ncbi:hypothetical protein LSTR_LSTR009912 [Laodelphax striatellus]|uniref:Protein hairless n=1 Tax=Laodelphax striatellus TaxID=195883 RepID=A0A482WKA1_LAOST|nr:hypothetical protein LSTR_LSTR009912 [Laodelphax striatellus]
MRIQDTYVSASCAKMTDEKNMNGDLSSGLKKEFVSESTNGPSSPNLTPGDSECSSSIGGGRLKFFKDGKFILELSHRKEGDRGGCWVPVPKKTTLFWPAVGTPRHESSTSLSVSDDNSSVQSSPWQRDHCWKQSSPRQNAGRGLEFFMVRPVKLRRLRFSYAIRRKRRRPLDAKCVDLNDCKETAAANNGSSRAARDKSSLAKVLRALWERVNRADPGIVSPRKRILREMESSLFGIEAQPRSQHQRSLAAQGRTTETGKLAVIASCPIDGEKDIIVTLEEQAKRQRARPESTKPPSHSITSILAREDEPSFLRTLLRSPDPPPPPPHTAPAPHPLFLSPPPPPLMYPPPHPASSSFLHPSLHHQVAWYPLASSLPRAYLHHPAPAPPPSHHYSPSPPPWGHLPPSHHHHSPASLKRDDTSDVPLNLSKHAG